MLIHSRNYLSTAPGKVRNLKVSPATHSITLTWSDPFDNPLRGRLEKFSITWNRGTIAGRGQREDLLVSDVPERKDGRRSFTITDLEADEDYYVAVNLYFDTEGTASLAVLVLGYLKGPLMPRLIVSIGTNHLRRRKEGYVIVYCRWLFGCTAG